MFSDFIIVTIILFAAYLFHTAFTLFISSNFIFIILLILSDSIYSLQALANSLANSKQTKFVNSLLPSQKTKQTSSLCITQVNFNQVSVSFQVHQINFSFNHLLSRFYYCYYNFIYSIFIPYCLYSVHF